MHDMRKIEIPPNVEISETSFKKAWGKAIRSIMTSGMKICTEYNNFSYDVCSRITLTEKAIDQIINLDVHKQDPFGKTRIKEYLKQFERDYDFKKQGFEYTYLDRFARYGDKNIDQLEILKNMLLEKKTTRRAQITTWIPSLDLYSDHPPCNQRLWVRPLTDKTCELHLTWRSRDAFGAWSSNLCGIMYMLQREVLKPAGLKVVKLVDFCDSLHVYNHDWKAAAKVTLGE